MHARAFDGAVLAAVPAPSTPLGPFEDSFVSWTSWTTLMGLLGVAALALIAAGPARKIGTDVAAAVTARLARAGAALGLLALAAVLTEAAHDAAKDGYDFGAAIDALYDGSAGGLLAGLEITALVVGLACVAPLVTSKFAASGARAALLTAVTVASAVALGTTKFPEKAPNPGMLGRTIFSTGMWLLHLWGGAVWIGGLIGLLALAVPGVLPAGQRGAFWSPIIRRFSVSAMSCVGAITLSGLFLYWAHVDGPSQLLTTMYGRVLGVKILIFGGMLLLGMVNQFWLHPRVEALRAGGDTRPLRTILVREFPLAIALEVLLGLAVLMVAPFLHGSARNQAVQAAAAAAAPAGTKVKDLPKAPPKTASASTWGYGTAETLIVIAVMAGGYRVSGQLARRRTATTSPAVETAPANLVDA